MMPEIERAWTNTCRVLLGDEIGPLDHYRTYLERYVDSISMRKSAISGKDIVVSSEKVSKEGRFLGQEEIGEYLKGIGSSKFDINSLKDLDSAVEELGEKAYYIGNVVLGNSLHVETANRCINSSFIYRTQDVYDCKYVAYSSMLRFAEYIFGGSGVGEGSKFNIKTFETYKNVRCMETVRNYVASDCYFTGNLDACTNCMFTFNQKHKSNMIGNLEFSRDEYQRLKGKLIEDIRETLKAKKSIPTIIDIINDVKNETRGES
jgi:hypothetical protein